MDILTIANSIPAAIQFAGDYFQTPEYQLVESNSYEEVVTFKSCISIDLKTDGEVVSNAIEEGSFMSYNKAIGPDEIDATLAFQGTAYDIQMAIQNLKDLQDSTRKVCFITPFFTWLDYSLENFDFSVKTENGIGVLYVDIVLVEIKEVETQYSDAKPIKASSAKNAGSTSSVAKGKQQAKTPDSKQKTTMLKDLGNLARGSI